jgi:hypothetical protein
MRNSYGGGYQNTAALRTLFLEMRMEIEAGRGVEEREGCEADVHRARCFGQERTRHSLDEMPPDGRALVERARRQSGSALSRSTTAISGLPAGTERQCRI